MKDHITIKDIYTGGYYIGRFSMRTPTVGIKYTCRDLKTSLYIYKAPAHYNVIAWPWNLYLIGVL